MKKLLIILILSISLIPARSMAADEYKLLEPLPCITGVTAGCSSGETTPTMNISSYILYIYKMSIALAVFLAIIMIIWGGFLYITSETPFKIDDGKGKIQNAVLGLAMVLVSYLILLTVDPRLVNIDTNIPELKIKDGDLEATKKFQNDLVDNLKTLSTDNLNKVNLIGSQITSLNLKKKELEDRISSGVGGEIDTENAKIELQKINNEIKGLQVEQKTVIAEDQGINNYAEIIKFAYDVKTNNSDDVYQAEKAAEQKIADQYNTKIAEIRKLGTNLGFEEIQKLEKQRYFYISQIREESVIGQIITSPAQNTGEVVIKKDNGAVERVNKKGFLTIKLRAYTADINNKDKQVASGLTPDQYTNILQNRINTIVPILNPPKK